VGKGGETMKEVIRGYERRRKSRMNVKGLIRLREEKLFSKGYFMSARVFDICEAGVKVAVPSPLKDSCDVNLHFQGRDMIVPIIIKGRVCWTRPASSGEKRFTVAGIAFKNATRAIFDRVATMLIANMA
jgi:hypothetical protein